MQVMARALDAAAAPCALDAAAARTMACCYRYSSACHPSAPHRCRRQPEVCGSASVHMPGHYMKLLVQLYYFFMQQE